MSVEKEKLRLVRLFLSGLWFFFGVFKSEDASFDLARILKCALQGEKKQLKQQ